MRIPFGVGRRARFLALAVALFALLGLGAPRLYFQFHLQQARAELRLRHAEAALTHLQAAKQVGSNYPELHFLLARAHRRLGRLDLARVHLERAWNSGFPVEYLQREQCLALAQAGQMAEAEPHLRRLLLNPGEDGAEICEAYVNGYFATYCFQQALGLLDAWQADFPNDPQPFVFRGVFAEHRGRELQAVEHYRSALRLDPENADVRLRLAKALSAINDHAAAEVHYRWLAERRPGDPEALVGVAESARASGDLDEGRILLRRVLDGHPDHAAGMLAMGRLELAADRPRQAVRWLTRGVAERPYDVGMRYALATALQAAGENERAKQHFEFVAAAQDALERARVLSDEVLMHPRDVQKRFEIGTILLQYSSPLEGAGWLQSVLKLQPDHVAAHQALAGYYQERGHSELAERHRKLAGSGRQQEGA